MTDIPQKYIDEAIRRMNEERETRGFAPGHYDQNNHTATAIVTLARTLQEFGWEPSVDPLLPRAREIAACAYEEKGWQHTATSFRLGQYDQDTVVKIALVALKENSNA